MSPIRHKRLSGLAIMLSALGGLFGLWHLAPAATFAFAVIALAALIVIFWSAGTKHQAQP